MSQPHRRLLHICSGVIALAATVVGTLLTVSFLRNLAGDSGLDLEFSVIGVLVDVSKALLPIAAIYLWRNRQVLASLMMTVLALTLLALSMMASIFAVESGLAATQLQDTTRETISVEITMKLAQADGARAVAEKYEALDRITKGKESRALAAQREAEAMALMKERDSLPEATTVTRLASQITLGVAVVIEWVAVGMSVLFALTGNPAPHPTNQPHKQAKAGPAEIESPAAASSTTQRYPDLVRRILSGELKPSVRGLAETKLCRTEIKVLLEELGAAGHLERYQGGWRRV